MHTKNTTSVAIVYHSFPHYRKGVINEIARIMPRATFIAENSDQFGGIPSMDFQELSNKFISVKNFNFFRYLFQPRVIWISIFGNYDAFIFLANPNFISTWIAAFICRIRGKRVIFWGHGFFTQNLTIKNRLRKIFFSLANAFYSYGYLSKKIAIKFGFSRDTLYVGFNSLDYSSQLLIRNNLMANTPHPTSPNKPLRIICISRLTKLCKYEQLLEALIIAKANFEFNATVIIIGDGPERNNLEKIAKENSLDVTFLGEIYDDTKVSRYIFESDVTVSPGKVGLTAMHSMMFGTPVISHKELSKQMPEVEAIVHGKTGILFSKDNVNELAQSIMSVCDVFKNRLVTQRNCFSMIDSIYNPENQAKIISAAVEGKVSTEGNDAFLLFKAES